MPENVDGTKILLGRGKIYFDRYDSNDALTGEYFLGNCPTFEITPTPEEIKKHSSASASADLIASDVIRTSLAIHIVGDEFSKENLARALYGDTSTLAQTGSAVVDEAVVALSQDRYYALEFRNVSNVVVKKDGGTPTYVVADDYTVDADTGRIYIVEGGDIEAGFALDVSYDYATESLNMIRGMNQTSVKGLIRFMGDPARGPVYECIIWKASVRADGAIGFISDEYAQWSLTGDIESMATAHPNEPHFRLIEVAA